MNEVKFYLPERKNIREVNRMLKEKGIPLRATRVKHTPYKGPVAWLFTDTNTGVDEIHWFTSGPLRAWFRSGVWQYNQMGS